jgi:hypothetical protein
VKARRGSAAAALGAAAAHLACSPATPAVVSATPSEAASGADRSPGPPRSEGACARFEREAVDVGISDVTAIALASTTTCALAKGRLVCADRYGGPFVEIADDVELIAGGDRIVAMRTGGRVLLSPNPMLQQRADLAALERDLAGWAQPVRAARWHRDRITLAGADGSVRKAKLIRTTTEGHEPIELAIVEPAAAPSAPIRALTTARNRVGQPAFACELAGDVERCSGRPVPMPGAVVDIDGSCALLEDGRVVCFEAGLTEAGSRETVATIPGAISVANDGAMGGCAVSRDGTVSCFGDMGFGFSARGISPFAEPVKLPGIADAVDFAILDGRACAVTREGRVRCLGCLELPGTVRALFPPLFGEAER